MNATQKTQQAITTLRAQGVNFRQIVEALKSQGHITSISHLSRILDGQREASEALGRAIAQVVADA